MQSTYYHLYLGMFNEVADIIKASARPSINKGSDVLGIRHLEKEWIPQALSDPQNESLKTLISLSVTDSSKATKLRNEGGEAVSEQQLFISEALAILEQKKPKGATDLSDAQMTALKKIRDAQAILNTQFKQLINIDNSVKHHHKLIDEVKIEINNLAGSHYSTWQDFRRTNLINLEEPIRKVLHEVGLHQLPQGEIDNLLRTDSWQEVLDRFQDTGAMKELTPAQLEKLFNWNKPTIASYFKLKAYLAIRSVNPSRENMSQYLKRLDPVFNKIDQHGDAITQQQKMEIQSLNDSKVKPILEVVDGNVATLKLLESSRAKVMHDVTSSQEIDRIQDKIRRTEPGPSEPGMELG